MGKKRQRLKETVGDQQPVIAPAVVVPFLEKHARTIAIVAVLFASARIAATYPVFNHTCDEPAHIACGLEWLDKGRYTMEPQHPPLARVAAAIGPYLLGAHSEWKGGSGFTDITAEGLRILYAGHQYDRRLLTARLGILPFFWVACWVVFEWGRRYFNLAIAALAVCIFSFLPPVLAHAGLATTDMAVTAFLGAAFLAALLWVEQPTAVRAALFGMCGGLAILSKFSSLVFFPAAVALALVWYLIRERPSMGDLVGKLRDRAATFALSALICCLVVWAGYRFSFGKVQFAHLSLPAPEFYAGIHQVSVHDEEGHPSYLLGERRATGWWYFFPVVLAVKTPLGVLLLLGVWLFLAVRKRLGFERWWLPMTFAAGILMVGMMSRIDIGLRHILPIYIGFSLMAAMAVYRMIEQPRERRWQAVALLLFCAWFAVSSLVSHPDYLAYFNELAGDHPENIVVDSDLDWGQDLNRLSKRLKQVGAQQVTLATYFPADLAQHGIPPGSDKLDVAHPPAGWVAISLSDWKVTRFGLMDRYPDVKLWPDLIPPTERVGKGIFLWYFPPGSTTH